MDKFNLENALEDLQDAVWNRALMTPDAQPRGITGTLAWYEDTAANQVERILDAFHDYFTEIPNLESDNEALERENKYLQDTLVALRIEVETSIRELEDLTRADWHATVRNVIEVLEDALPEEL